jgi:hypothetical protein
MDIRKQVYDLTRQDLKQFPVWEFALDEEGEPGQDEATVKPRPDLDDGVDSDEGIFVVRAEFKAADGSTFDGFVTPEPDGDLGATQPSIVTSEGHVSFWFGGVEPEQRAIKKSYATLGAKRGELFPMTFRAAVPVDGARSRGRCRGLCISIKVASHERSTTDGKARSESLRLDFVERRLLGALGAFFASCWALSRDWPRFQSPRAAFSGSCVAKPH